MQCSGQCVTAYHSECAFDAFLWAGQGGSVLFFIRSLKCRG